MLRRKTPEALVLALILVASLTPTSNLASAETAATTALSRRMDDGILVIDFGGAAGRPMGSRELFQAVEPLQLEIGRAVAVVLDLRAGPPLAGVMDFRPYVLEQLASDLVSRPCRAPAERYLLHSGYRPQNGGDSGGYYSGFLTLAADSYSPKPEAPAVPRRVVFVVDRWTAVPAVALALQACGDGRIVSQGPLSDESFVTVREIPLGEGLIAQVRVSEIVPPGGAAPLPIAVFRPDRAYPEMLAPDLAWRQLAVIRAWNVIHWFYPYLHLIDDWDAVLPEFLARMDGAQTGRDYALTVLEMMAHVADGHTMVYGHPELPKFFGEAGLPSQLRWIEEAKPSGIRTGDALLAVDGEPVGTRIERLSRYLTASTKDALLDKICGYPQGTAWSIAPRINTRKAKIGAQFRRSQVAAFSEEEAESGFYFSQPLPESRRDLPLYTRPIVMVIDDRAISQSEHSGLFFEAANGTRFVGSPTAGANGDVTNFPLPGGLTVGFTGHVVRHADGRQLQRIGLQPDVEVAPTRRGLRAGRDEVLERAVLDLENRLRAP